MPRIILAVLVCLLPALVVAAEETSTEWKKSADLGLIINQAGYSDSWAGDELGTFNWTLKSDIAAERHLSDSTLWTNQFKLVYGKTTNEVRDEMGDRSWGDAEKSTDRIFLESLVKFQEGSFVNPYVAFTVESQFHDDMDNFFSPALYVESAGLGRNLMKTEETEVFSRIGFAYRQRTASGLDTTTDGGLEWVTDVSHVFNENLKAVSKLRVFQAFTSSADDDLADDHVAKDYWKTTDVAWEINLSASVSKYVQTTLFFELLYDKEINTDTRYRDILGIGVTYKLF